MKPIFIRKGNFNLKELMTTLEVETSVVSKRNNFSPRKLLKFWQTRGSTTVVYCDNEGIFGDLDTGQEIHCMEDFVAAVKEQFPKKEEEFCVDLRYVNVSVLKKEIEDTSSMRWCDGRQPTLRKAYKKYLGISNWLLIDSHVAENKTELTPAQFIKKCAELCPPKSVYDYLNEGDVCLVRNFKNHGWVPKIYKGNKFFIDSSRPTDCSGTTWEQVKPLGINIYDILKKEN